MTTTTIPSKEEALKSAVRLCLVNGAVDLIVQLNYSSISYAFRKCEAPFDRLNYTALQRAAHQVMRDREGNGCMMWEIDIERFVDAYMKILGEDADAPDQS